MTQLERLIEECKSAPQPDVLDALNLVVRRRIEREHEAERASKHAAILPLCRGAREKLVRLRDIELPGAAARVWQSWQAL